MKLQHAYFFNRYTVFIFFSVLCILSYSNTFFASWHLDDFPNIVNNVKLHLVQLSPQSLIATFTANPADGGNSLYRPLSCLTFGLNWYFGKGNVFGYHIVNILLHILTGYLLYCTILTLFQTPKLKQQKRTDVYLIAFLATLLWLVHPLQTQAVTYIVQRMTVLGAFFYILAMYFFLKARLVSANRPKIFYISGCFLAYIAALASKENTVTLPLALLLIEIIFFQKKIKPLSGKTTFFILLFAIIILLEGGYILIKLQNWSFFRIYDQRSFSPMERFLTEHRIVLFYLSQLFFPAPQRLSLIHDFSLSTSLLHPWTTLPALLLVYSFISLAVLYIPKKPLLSFSILFFFLNHLIESTILPLELIFEHRNYLPSLFLFLPVATALQQLFTKFNKKRWLRLTLATFIITLVASLSYITYTRNAIWKDEYTLWLDTLKKAPNDARPYQNLAMLLSSNGRYLQAIALYQKALSKQAPSPARSVSLSLNNMGNVYLSLQQYDKAIKSYNSALQIDPDNPNTLYNKTVALVAEGKWNEASSNADKLTMLSWDNSTFFNIKGFILLKLGTPEVSLPYFDKAYALSPSDRNVIVNYATAKSLLGYYRQAEDLLRNGQKKFPSDITILLSLLENSYREGNTERMKYYAKKILADFSSEQIENSLPTTQEKMNSSILSSSTLHTLLIEDSSK